MKFILLELRHCIPVLYKATSRSKLKPRSEYIKCPHLKITLVVSVEKSSAARSLGD